ncbi:MAG TPA: glycosyltransferase, partial [Candidatus Acidoferrum sp.]|nr:glycosyltransferase [Candidatus Acidoferrum sp.]
MSGVIMSHPTGNANVRAVLAALDRDQLLDTFYTTVGLRSGGFLQRTMPRSFRGRAQRRAYEIEHGHIVFHPLREMLRLIGCGNIDAVYADLDQHVAAQLASQHLEASAVYCYEDGALETFRAAQALGMTRFYDLPIAYWETSQRLLREEVERLPAWEPTLVGTRDSQEKLARKTEELELANVVICPSRFVEESLPAAVRASRMCVRAEFGSPIVGAARSRGIDSSSNSTPLRVLFAGSMTQRKGLADVFAAMKLLNRSDVQLVVMGSPVAPLDFYRKELAIFEYEPPRPHAEVLALMQRCDVFVLPSLVEGRALVQQEAMACGLPLIVTANAGGDDLIEEGGTGFLIPIRAPEKIAEKIAWFADHRDALPAMREATQRKAVSYTWERYG